VRQLHFVIQATWPESSLLAAETFCGRQYTLLEETRVQAAHKKHVKLRPTDSLCKAMHNDVQI
jgi:hypothetical protein